MKTDEILALYDQHERIQVEFTDSPHAVALIPQSLLHEGEGE